VVRMKLGQCPAVVQISLGIQRRHAYSSVAVPSARRFYRDGRGLTWIMGIVEPELGSEWSYRLDAFRLFAQLSVRRGEGPHPGAGEGEGDTGVDIGRDGRPIGFLCSTAVASFARHDELLLAL
jgi:hypothetical protein